MSMEPAGRWITLEPQGVLARTNLALLLGIPIAALAALAFAGWKLALVVLVVGAGVVLAFAFDDVKAAFAWRQARLDIPQARFELGSTHIVRYRRDTKRPRDIGSCVVECTLVCRETVHYQQGTDTKTDRSIVFTKAFAAPGQGTTKGLEADVPIVIPVNKGAPSFDLPSNKVEWFVTTEVQGVGLPQDDQRFEVVVIPTLYREPERVQDS